MKKKNSRRSFCSKILKVDLILHRDKRSFSALDSSAVSQAVDAMHEGMFHLVLIRLLI